MSARTAQRLAAFVLAIVSAGATAQPPASATATPLIAKPLAGIDGKEGVVLAVEYPPGVASAYARPLALGNFLHFFVVTVMLVKVLFEVRLPPIIR